MPTYEYECKSCKYTFDAFQSMRDEPLKVCPKCGKEIRRVIAGGATVIFKGSGFYVTDKGGKAGNSDRDGNTDHASKTSGTKTGGSESAPCAACPKSDACPKAAS